MVGGGVESCKVLPSSGEGVVVGVSEDGVSISLLSSSCASSVVLIVASRRDSDRLVPVKSKESSSITPVTSQLVRQKERQRDESLYQVQRNTPEFCPLEYRSFRQETCQL